LKGFLDSLTSTTPVEHLTQV